MIIYSRLYKSLSIILSITIFASLFLPAPILGSSLDAPIHTSNPPVGELPLGRSATDLLDLNTASTISTKFSDEQLANMGVAASMGQFSDALINTPPLQASTNNALQELTTHPPLTVSRVQSTYVATNAISNTLVITFTVTNNLPPGISPEISPDATITETLDAVLAVDHTRDPNIIRNVLLTDEILPAQTTFISASPQPDRDNNIFAWNLGDISPLDTVTVTLKLTTPGSVSDFVELDTGVTVWGTLQGQAVSNQSGPILLAPDGFEEWLVCTIDANCKDEYIVEKAAELGNDPTAIFNYVRSLDYESYKGSLRGARGTLWSEAGNAMDQASLLIALLRAGGIPAAYRSGTLDDVMAQDLISSMFVEPSGVLGHIPDNAPVADPFNDQRLLAVTKEHWWVEAYLPGLGWQHLDPSFADASMGDVFVSLPGPRQAEVPDTLRHKVTVKVKIEQYHPLNFGGMASGLSESYPMVYTFNAVELVGRPVTLGHVVDTEAQGGSIFYSVQHTYIPYLAVDDLDYTIEGHPFQDLFSNFPFGTFITTGEWLLFEIQEPGGEIETYTVEVKDKLGFEARQAGGVVQANSQDTSPFVLEHDLVTFNIAGYKDVPQEVLLSQSEELQRLAPAIKTMQADLALLEEDDPETQDIIQKHNRTMMNARMNLGHMMGGYFLTTARWARDYYSDRLLVRSYPATPKVVIISQKESSGEISYDLIHVKERVIANPGQAAYVENMFQMLSGTMDTAIEDFVLVALFDASPISAHSILQAARDSNIEFAVITEENLHALDNLPISDEAKARIADAVKQGKIVTVPSQMIEVNNELTIAWLETDPTGYTIGVGENGQHQALTELGHWISSWERGQVTATVARIGGFVSTILLAVTNVNNAKKAAIGAGVIWIFLKGTGNPVLKQVADKLMADLIAINLFRSCIRLCTGPKYP